MKTYLDSIKFNAQNLVPVTAVDATSKMVLMQAWMNREAVEKTIETNKMVYFSRSRNRLWMKGESSGHIQNLQSLYLDCDGDSIIAEVEQIGGIACHTGHQSCFYRVLSKDKEWQECQPLIKNAEEIYGK